MADFIWLVFAHYIGDIALQNDWQADSKRQYWYIMLSHCIVWTAIVSIALQWLGLFTIGKGAFLLMGHFIADEVKCRQPKTPETWWMIYPDQLWHLFQCLIVYLVR